MHFTRTSVNARGSKLASQSGSPSNSELVS